MRPRLRFPDEFNWQPPQPLIIRAGTVLYRVQSRAHDSPIHFGLDPQGDKRWNPPPGVSPQYGVLYAGTSPHAAIAETLIHDERGGVIGLGELTSRVLWRFTVKADLAIIDLTGPALKRIGHDAKLLSTDDLRYPKAWSHALHGACPEAHGLLYPSQPALKYTSLALFERSCGMLAASSGQGAAKQLLVDWIEPDSRENIVDWLQPFGISIYDDGSLGSDAD